MNQDRSSLRLLRDPLVSQVEYLELPPPVVARYCTHERLRLEQTLMQCYDSLFLNIMMKSNSNGFDINMIKNILK